MNQGFIIVFRFAIVIIVILQLFSCTPAPHGIHGLYELDSNKNIYQANNLCKDSFLNVLVKEHIAVKPDTSLKYGAPWDSLRYLLGNIPCDSQHIEAYVEFKDKRANNVTFRLLWFNATPTKDDKIYQKLAESFYKCFDSFLKGHNLIK